MFDCCPEEIIAIFPLLESNRTASMHNPHIDISGRRLPDLRKKAGKSGKFLFIFLKSANFGKFN
jgi:hypothetical protein